MSRKVKEVKVIIDKLVDQGWRVERGNHWCAYPPNAEKRMVYFPQTPSDARSINNMKSQLRKSGAIL